MRELIDFTFVQGIETKFAGSSCNDLVTSDGSGSTIISGHFDKRIRFWDTRADSNSDDISLHGKITSLDLSRGISRHILTHYLRKTLKHQIEPIQHMKLDKRRN